MIELTDNARDQVKEMLLEEEENSLLRFGIQGGGCSGLSYAIGFDTEVNEDLDVTATINEIPVVIKKMDLPIVDKTVIDFKQNMMGGGFVINNPNAIVSCGCGTSFRTAEAAGAPGDC